MDYHSLKRSELQALCKKHNIPANFTNAVMADKLSELLNVKQEKQKPRARQRTCIKSAVETIDETESAVSRRQAKRVRFSPEVEYERSDKKQKALEPVVTEMKGRRKSVAKNGDEPVIDNVNTVTDDVQIPVKVTRSRAHILGKDDVIPTNVSKQGRRAVKDVEKESDAVTETEVILGKVTRSKANTVGKGDFQLDKIKQSKRAVKDVEKESDPVKETIVRPVRVTRLKAQTVTEDSKDPDMSPQVKRKSGRQTEKHEVNVELSKEVKDVAVRVTRSRGQTSNDDSVVANPAMVKRRTRRDDSVVANLLIEKKTTVAENSKDPDLSPQGKKKSGKRTEKDVELSKEVNDVVVRVTRSRGQTSNDDSVVANLAAEKKRTRRDDTVVANPPIEKKRTRRDTIVAEVSKTQDNADKGARQLRRNKATVEDSTIVNQNLSKVECVNEKKVTRSKDPLANKSSRGKGKSKAEDKEDEEPLEPAGRNNVTRRKSVIQLKNSEVVLPLEERLKVPARNTRRKSVIEPKNTEVVLSLEEPLNVPAKKDTRRKSVIQPKITEVVHPLEEHVHVPARKDTRRKSIVQPENTEVVLPLEEPVNVPAKKETKRKSVVEKAQPKKSEKPLVLKRETVKETELPRSPSVTTRKTVEKKQSTDASESEMKAVASGSGSQKFRKQRIDPIIENQIIETEPVFTGKAPVAKKEQGSGVKTPASRKGVMTEDNRPKKRAKLSGIKQSDSEDHPEKSNTVVTPISKMANLELDDKVIKTEQTPAIAESGRRLTRGLISRSNRKEPSRSAIKEQNTGAACLISPGRFIRSGIKVVEKAQPSESTHQSQPLDDAQVASCKDAEARSIPDETIADPSEVSKEANAQILELSGGLSALESVKLPTVDALSDGSHVQNQNREGHVSSEMVGDAEVQVTVNSEKSVIPEVSEKEMNLTNLSGIKQSDSENLPEKSNTEGTPILKMANLELDDKVIETEQTPTYVKSGRRMTRGVSRSDMKKPRQSAIKEQNIGAARLSSRKTPGRFTRSGIKVVEKAQPSESTHQSQPVDDAQVASRKDAEASSSPDETIAGPTEVSKESNAQILDQSGEFVRLPTIDALSDGTHVQNQNQEVHVSSEMVSETEVQVMVNSEKPAIPEVSEKEMELTKLSGIKQSDSENHPEKYNTEGTPILKMANLELDDKVFEIEQTPVIAKSGRRLTRAVSQSANKEQNTGAARLTSRKTPGRFTRSGIKVDEKAQPSESTHQRQSFDDAQVASREDAEASPSPDETIAGPSEVSKESNAQILEQSSDLSAFESVKLPTVDALSDGSRVQIQNQEVHVSSEMVSEVEFQVTVNSEKSANPEASEKEMELTKSGSTSEGLENDARVEEPFVSVVKTVVTEESVDISLEQSDIKGKSKEIEALVEPSVVEGVSQFIADDQAYTKIDDNDHDNEEDENGSNQKYEDVADKADTREIGIVVDGDDVEPKRDDILEPSTGDDKLESFGMDENDIEDVKVTVPESSTTHSEPKKEFVVEDKKEPATVPESSTAHSEPAKELDIDAVPSTGNDVHDALEQFDDEEGVDNFKEPESNTNDKDGDSEKEFVFEAKKEPATVPESSTAHSEPAKELDTDTVSSVGNYTKIDDNDHDNEEDENGSNQKYEDVADKADTREIGIVVDGDDVEPKRDDILEPSTGDDKLESFGMDENDIEDVKVTVPESSTTHSEPKKEFVVEDKKEPATVPESSTAHSEPAKELDIDAVPSTGNDVHDALGQFDDEEGVDNFKEPESNTNDKDGDSEKEFVFEAKKEPATVPESSTAHSEPAKELDTDTVSSVGNNVHEIPILGQFEDPEFNTNEKDGESEQELLTSCYSSAMEDQDVGDEEPEPIQNENAPVLPEVFTSSSDQEPEPSQNEDVPEDLTKSPDLELEPEVNLAVNEAPCNSVDASTSKEAPQSPELVDEKEQTDSDKFQENPTIEESLPIEYAEEESTADELATSQLPGGIGAYGSPIRERNSSVDDIVSDPPTSFKNEDRNKQEDWGSYSYGTDGLQNPVSANGSDDVSGQSTRDAQVSGLQTTSPAVANATQEFFDWTDSTLKALLTTPGTTQVSRVKERQQSTVRFALPDKDDTEINAIQSQDLSLKTFFTTPATTQVRHAKDPLESTVVGFSLPDEDYNATQNQDSVLKTMFATPATTQVIHIKEHEQSTSRFASFDKGDREGNATRDPDSSLKELLKTPATTRASHVQGSEQIPVRSALSAEDDTEQDATQNINSSLKALFKTPGTTQISRYEDHNQTTEKNALPDESKEEGNATQSLNSSLKTLFATAATTRISRVKDAQENSVNIAQPDEDDNATQNAGMSLKALFTTPATTRFSDAKSRQESTVRFALSEEDATEGSPPQNPDSSPKTFATPAASQISHVKDSQQHEVSFALRVEDGTNTTQDPTQIPDLSLKTVFTNPATTPVTQENLVRNVLPDEDEREGNASTQIQGLSLKTLFETPATTQVTHVKQREQSTVRFALPDEDDREGNTTQNPNSSFKALSRTPATSQNPDSSLKTLFATPATTQGSYVEESHQSAFRFALPGDSFHQEEKQGTATQHQNLSEDRKNETSGFMSFEEFSHKYFDDEEVDYGSDENEGKKKVNDLNQHVMPSETAGTSHYDASGFKDRSNEPSTEFNDNTHGNATGSPDPIEDPKSETFGGPNFDFARKFFDDYGSSDNSGDEMKQHDTGRQR